MPARGAYFDAALREGRILVRAGNRWSAYAVADGHRLWRRTVPAQPQFLPYGFELDSVPMLDADHALIGGTTALHTPGPAHRGDDLGGRCRPTGSTRPTGPTRRRSAPG